MQAYCVRCREKVEVKSPKRVTMKNKRPAVKGECPGCGTTVYRIVSQGTSEQGISPG